MILAQLVALEMIFLESIGSRFPKFLLLVMGLHPKDLWNTPKHVSHREDRDTLRVPADGTHEPEV